MIDRKLVAGALGATVLCALIAGCASDPRAAVAPGWIAEQAAERARLEEQGFPQFTGPN